MAVQGIELAVGQRWLTRSGRVCSVLSEIPGKRNHYHWEVKGLDGVWAVTHEGFQGVDGAPRNGDLIELVAQAAPAPVPDGVDLPIESIELAAADLPNRAPDILEAAAGHMRDRAATFDKPEGERSMAQTVAIFNQFHGTGMTEAQGWHFMQILKDVRLFTRDGYHQDSGEDCVAYAALKCEAKAREGGAAC